MIREQEWEGGTWVVGKKKKEKKISYVGGRRKKERGGIFYGNKEVESNRMGKEDILGVVKKINK